MESGPFEHVFKKWANSIAIWVYWRVLGTKERFKNLERWTMDEIMHPSNDFMASAIFDIQKLLDLLKLTTGGVNSMIFHVYSFPLFSVSKNFTDFKDGFCYTAMLKRIRCGKPRREDGKRLHEVDICVDGSVVLKCWKWRFFKGWTTCVVFFVRKVSHCLLFFVRRVQNAASIIKMDAWWFFCASWELTWYPIPVGTFEDDDFPFPFFGGLCDRSP